MLSLRPCPHRLSRAAPCPRRLSISVWRRSAISALAQAGRLARRRRLRSVAQGYRAIPTDRRAGRQTTRKEREARHARETISLIITTDRA